MGGLFKFRKLFFTCLQWGYPSRAVVGCGPTHLSIVERFGEGRCGEKSSIRRIFAENILYFCCMKERRAIYIGITHYCSLLILVHH